MYRVILLAVLCGYTGARQVYSNEMIVFVNGGIVLRLDALNATSRYNVEYRYVVGDKVDVSGRIFMSMYELSTVDLYYDYFDQLGGYDVHKTSPLSSSLGVGMSNTLRAEHNNSRITFIWKRSGYNATFVHVNLLLQTDHNSVVLYINDATFRQQEEIRGTHYLLYIMCTFNKRLKFVIDEEYFTIQGSKYHDGRSTRYPKLTPNKTVEITPKSNLAFVTYILSSKSTNKTLEYTIILRQDLGAYNGSSPLSLSTSEHRNMLTLYARDGDQLMVYEFVEGESVTFNCSTSYERGPPYGYHLNFNGTEGNGTSIIRHFQLRSSDNNTTVVCSLNDNYNVVTKTTILFHQVKIVANSSFVEDESVESTGTTTRTIPTVMNTDTITKATKYPTPLIPFRETNNGTGEHHTTDDDQRLQFKILILLACAVCLVTVSVIITRLCCEKTRNRRTKERSVYSY